MLSHYCGFLRHRFFFMFTKRRSKYKQIDIIPQRDNIFEISETKTKIELIVNIYFHAPHRIF